METMAHVIIICEPFDLVAPPCWSHDHKDMRMRSHTHLVEGERTPAGSMEFRGDSGEGQPGGLGLLGRKIGTVQS